MASNNDGSSSKHTANNQIQIKLQHESNQNQLSSHLTVQSKPAPIFAGSHPTATLTMDAALTDTTGSTKLHLNPRSQDNGNELLGEDDGQPSQIRNADSAVGSQSDKDWTLLKSQQHSVEEAAAACNDENRSAGLDAALMSRLEFIIPDQSQQPTESQESCGSGIPSNGDCECNEASALTGTTSGNGYPDLNEHETQREVLDERPASEIALTNGLALESVFKFMDVSTLLACRLVCKQWKYFGAKELERNPCAIHISFLDVCKIHQDDTEYTAENLVQVIQNSENGAFPCTSFSITTDELSSSRVQHFLISIGSRIKKLWLTLAYMGKITTSFDQSTFLDDLRILLHLQTTNLEFLFIRLYLPYHWLDEIQKWDSDDSSSSTMFRYPHFFRRQDSSRTGQVVKACRLPKLKALVLYGSVVPKKFVIDLMDAAVNLQVFRGTIVQTPMTLIDYFMEGAGKFRIHLLRHLDDLELYLLNPEYIEIMERFLAQHKHNPKLEAFYLCPSFWFMMHTKTVVWPRISRIVNKILERSVRSLTQFTIGPLRFLPGLVIPHLPNLEELVLTCNGNPYYNHNGNDYFFPKGFNMAKSFPKVYRIFLLTDSISKSLIHKMGVTEPVPSVKFVYQVCSNGPTVQMISPDLLAVFPNLVSKG